MKLTDKHGLTGLGFALLLVSVILATIGLVAFVANLADQKACKAVGDNATGVTSDWKGPAAGCYITENDRTVPLDKWRVISK